MACIQLLQCGDGERIINVDGVDGQGEARSPNGCASICQPDSNGCHKARKIVQAVPVSSGIEFSPAAMETFQRLMIGIKSVCMIHEVQSQDLARVLKKFDRDVS